MEAIPPPVYVLSHLNAVETAEARSAAGTVRVSMSIMAEGATASPAPITAL